MRNFGELRRDRLKGLILDRQVGRHLTDQDMANILGVSRGTWSHMINWRHTDEWELGQLVKVCIRLNITEGEFKDHIPYRAYKEG